MLHALEQRADAAAAVIGDGAMALDREGEFLVLGADAEPRLRFAARFEPRDELVARLDRRHVDLVTGHAGFRRKGPRPYTDARRKSNEALVMPAVAPARRPRI